MNQKSFKVYNISTNFNDFHFNHLMSPEAFCCLYWDWISSFNIEFNIKELSYYKLDWIEKYYCDPFQGFTNILNKYYSHCLIVKVKYIKPLIFFGHILHFFGIFIICQLIFLLELFGTLNTSLWHNQMRWFNSSFLSNLSYLVEMFKL